MSFFLYTSIIIFNEVIIRAFLSRMDFRIIDIKFPKIREQDSLRVFLPREKKDNAKRAQTSTYR